MSIKVLIIADDLTGALDTGVQMAKAGVKVLPKAPAGISEFQDSEVLIVNTDSRHCPSGFAYEQTRRIALLAKQAGIPVIYKKTDSAMRGNIGAELAGAMDGASQKHLYFVPAFPKLNRFTINGIQYIQGKPLARSAFQKDPLNPATESSVLSIISQQTNHSLSLVRCTENPEAASQADIMVFDSDSESRMRDIAEYLTRQEKPLVLGGCAGLARYLPQICDIRMQVNLPVCKGQAGVLVISGSLNSANIEQISHAVSRGFEIRSAFELDGFSDSDDFEPDPEQIDTLLCQYRSSRRMFLSVTRPEYESEVDINTDEWIRQSFRINQNIGKVVAVLFERGLDALLVVTGGDTLGGITASLDIRYLQPCSEIEPGVVTTYFHANGNPHFLVAKAGSFGSISVYDNIFSAFCQT